MSKTTNKFSPEVRERAVRLVLDNQGQHGSRWQAVLSISSKIGCAPQTLNDWVNKAEVDSGKRAGVSIEMAENMKALERENRELRQANEILRKASAYFAMAELDTRINARFRGTRSVRRRRDAAWRRFRPPRPDDWAVLRAILHMRSESSHDASALMEDQAVKVVGDVGERQFGFRAGQSDRADEQAEAVLLMCEDVLDPGADG